MGRRIATAAVAVLLMAGLSACAEDSGDGEAAGVSEAPTPGAGAPVTKGAEESGQQDPGDGAGDLADLAEQLAQDAGSGDIAPVDGEVLGADISWPQCPPGMGIPEKRTLGMPMPVPDARFVIVGLTNGPGFTPNPCLADQVDWVTDHRLLLSAYSVSSYPDDATLRRYGDQGPYDASDPLGRLSNVGYQQARYNIGTMGTVGLQTPIVWIDVEPVPDFEWSTDKAANAAVIEGVARGYVDAGFAIGVYSTPYLWDEVVGDLRLEVPEWRAAGQTSREEALARCGADWSIQGGEPVFGQWVEDRRDHNVTCPGIGADLGRWFHQT